MIVAREKTGWHQTGADSEKPARQVKRPRKSPKPKVDRLLVTGMVLVFFLTGLMITYYYARLFSLSYQISRLEKELAGLKVENHSLEEEVSRLASLERVEALAVNKLGMVRPEGGRVLVVTLPENQKGAPGMGVNERVQSPVQTYKSALIEAFDELVNRVETKSWFKSPYRQSRDLKEGRDAGSNGNCRAEENNRYFSGYQFIADRAHISTGLASIG